MNQFNALVGSIVSNLKSGNADSAIAASKKAIQVFGDNAALYEYYARSLALKQQFAEAASAQQRAVQLGGAELTRVLYLGELLLNSGELQVAADVFQQVIKSVENHLPAWLGLGHCLLLAEDYARAEKCYLRVLEDDEDNSLAQSKLAICLLKQGDALKALDLLERVKKKGDLTPDSEFFLAESLRFASRFEEAEEVFQSLRKIPEWRLQAEKGIVTVWLSLEEYDQACVLLDKLLAEQAGDPELISYKARVLMVEGDKEGARQLIKQQIEKGDQNPVLWEMLSDMLTEPYNDHYLGLLTKLRDDSLAKNERRVAARCYFALSRHYEKAGDLDKEVDCLEAGNDLYAVLEPFDSKGHARGVKRVRDSYTADQIASLADDTETFSPVFILCPPRSGSTLLEQALARHSMFNAGGERPFADHAWYRSAGGRSVVSCLERHESMTHQLMALFRSAYLDEVRKAGLDPGKMMIHKGIAAHKFAGLLKAAFPRAKFIELVRDPMDVAFGCYKQNFESQPFANTYEGCVEGVKLYQEDMVWWREQMPYDIYTMSYSGLVTDFKDSLTGLLNWLGLQWEDACMDFAAASRVGTASASQVRQGLFTEGVGRWKKYGNRLNKLEKMMEESRLL